MKKMSQTILSSLVCGCLAPSLLVAWGKHSPQSFIAYGDDTPQSEQQTPPKAEMTPQTDEQSPTSEELGAQKEELTPQADEQSPPKEEMSLQKEEEAPLPSFNANRIAIRQIEGKGIGYTRGYTTIDFFLTPYQNFDTYLPFLDARFHRFDNGKYAYNAGLGLRGFCASSCRIWGINAYYDYRQTNHANYKQVGLGLEFLGLHWDYRINGYIPIGKTESNRYNVRFDRFKGNNFFVNYKREFAMPGVDAEAAYHWIPGEKIDITAALGPYYYHGRYNKFAAGGKARVEAKFFNAISIEGIASYDNFFKWNGQGQLSFAIPLGPQVKDRKIAQSCCNRPMNLEWRLVQPVERAEIIVAGTQRKDTIAINPATGQPYFFVFVNNTSHSNGTFESPYHTLLDAQNNSTFFDIIYVYTGDGTATGMNAGMVLKNNQQLLGAGFSYPISTPLGNVTVPAQDSGYPLITNAGANGVTLANNNTVLGVNVGNSSIGIAGASFTNAVIGLNLFSSPTAQTNIQMLEVGGNVNIINNTFLGVNTSSNAVSMTLNTTPSVNVAVQCNTMTAVSGTAINITGSGNNTLTAFIYNNVIDTLGTEATTGVNIASTGPSSQINARILSNVINGYDDGIVLNQSNTGTASITATIEDNTLNTAGISTDIGININQNGLNTVTNANITGNTISNFAMGCINVTPTASGTGASSFASTIIDGNTLNNAEVGINIAPIADTYVQLNAKVTNNTLINCGDCIAIAPTTNNASSICTSIVDVASNTFNVGTTAIGVNPTATMGDVQLTATINSNVITGVGEGISLSTAGSTNSVLVTVDVGNNTINGGTDGIVISPEVTTNNFSTTLTNNSVTGSTNGITVTAFNGGDVAALLASNNIEGSGAATAMKLISQLGAGGTICFNVNGNSIFPGGTLTHTGAGTFNIVNGFETNNMPQNAFVPPLGVTTGIISSVTSCD